MDSIEKQQKITKKEKEAYAIVGRYRGRANFLKHGREHMGLLGKKGAQKRWNSNKSRTKEK